MIPTPERVVVGELHWFVWLLVPKGSRREYRLKMVRRS